MADSRRIGWSHTTEQTYADGWRVTLTDEESEAIKKSIREWHKVTNPDKQTFQEEDDLFTI